MCAAVRTFISFYWNSNIVERNVNCLESLTVFLNKCRIWVTSKQSLTRMLVMVYFDKEFDDILTSSFLLSEDSFCGLLRVCYKYTN